MLSPKAFIVKIKLKQKKKILRNIFIKPYIISAGLTLQFGRAIKIKRIRSITIIIII